ncbi:YdcF family protein [Candidatus Peregrinibacteria bacterium]|nr:YdcF family protein [Candidatus Peregrinibacteria bacterium]
MKEYSGMCQKKILFWLIGIGTFLLLVGGALPIFLVHLNSKGKIFSDLNTVPSKKVAIVFGASVLQNSFPSVVLYDRVATASELYFAKKVQKILMTGDNSQMNYNEAQVMKKTAMEFGVHEEDIVLDFAGFRTFDSCARAQKIFGITDAIVVSQEYHLPRVIYLCENFGIDVVGFVADKNQYEKQSDYEFREVFAIIAAFFEVNLFPHDPKFLGEEVQMFGTNSRL